MSYLMISKRALVTWLRSIPVEISYVSSTGKGVSFRRENCKPFDVFGNEPPRKASKM